MELSTVPFVLNIVMEANSALQPMLFMDVIKSPSSSG